MDLVACQQQHCSGPIDHPEAHGEQNDGRSKQPRQGQPQRTEPPSHKNEIERAEYHRVLRRIDDTDNAAFIHHRDILSAAQRRDLWERIEHDDANGQPDDADGQHPGNRSPNPTEPPPKEEKPENPKDEVGCVLCVYGGHVCLLFYTAGTQTIMGLLHRL